MLGPPVSKPEVDMRFRGCRHQLHGPLAEGDGMIVLPELAGHIAQPVEGLEVVGVVLQGTPQQRFRLLPAALLAVRFSQVRQGGEVVRIKLQRLLQQGHGLLRPAAGAADRPQVGAGRRRGLALLQQLAVDRLGFGGALLLQEVQGLLLAFLGSVSRRAPRAGEAGHHPLDHLAPVARPLLAEETHGGIPKGAVALLAPAPVAGVVEQQPGGRAQAAGQVHQGAVSADHQVAGQGDGAGFHKIPAAIDHRLAGHEQLLDG